ncbi:MAG: cytochrome c biogenesis protein CcsA, partial [Planctomycetes bacterium]|nr:cytochrome c biogenesis protein CcsA [Planctomycetota bacterium]
LPLGFEVRLDKFRVGRYPGSGQPRSFESHVTFIDAGGGEQGRVISMNNPAKFGRYRLFQSSYQQGRSGPATSVLSVSWDPGQPIVFAGYIGVIAAMLYVLGTRVRGKKNEKNGTADGPAPTPVKTVGLRVPGRANGLVLLLGVLGVLAVQPSWARAAAGNNLPQHLDLSIVRAIPVQHNGRWMPLDTVARDVVESVTGEMAYRGQDAVLWLLAWTFEPRAWLDEPLITIRSAELRSELKLPADQEVFSYAHLVRHQPLRKLMDEVSQRSGKGKPNPLESKVSDINQKLGGLQDVFQNEVIRPIPDASDATGAWEPIDLPARGDNATLTPLQAAWSDLRSAFLADDANQFADAAKRLSAELAKLPAAHRPNPRVIDTELVYNRIHPYNLAWKIMVLGAVLAAVAVGVNRRWMDAVAIVALLAGFGALSYGMCLRWQIAGRIPAANMFESLLFLSWGAGAFAIVSMLAMRDRLVPLTASGLGALSLFLADVLPLDHFIRPIPPVLMDTVWMSIHVPGIMVSYAVLALATLIAHAQIVTMALAPRRQQLIAKLDSLHYWYVHVGTILLGAGIITGSMWAASSWGRYWGWDPKEVWSLVAFLAYLVILHVRTDHEVMPGWIYAAGLVLAAALFVVVVPKLAPLTALKIASLAGAAAAGAVFILARGQFATALKSAVAFWFIIMTYVGVNFVLGIGLHSYGFGTGAVVRYMLLTGSIDLALVGVLTCIYLARRPSATVSAG